MTPYTRDNILSPMLKTVIIRIDFSGLTDVCSFVNRIKSHEKMRKAFEKMTMIPKQNMSVNFKPKDIEDGLLPITETQHSIIYRFHECNLGGHSKATLDVDQGSITLAVDCREKYKGSYDYSYFMGWLIDELRASDQYVVINRLGVRKIDVQVLKPKEPIEEYFSEKFIVTRSWMSPPKKTKSIVTELFEIDDIFFNVTQLIDRINDERVRLIYDVDSFLNRDILDKVLESRNISEFLYHDMQDHMFELFVSVTSEHYLNYCKQLKTEQHGS